MKAPDPGLYPGTPDEEYFAWDAINCSTLKHYKKSAAHARMEMDKPRDTTCLKIGRAIHVATLEPEKFDDRYVVGPEGNANSLKYKEKVAKLTEDFPNHEMLRPKEKVICDATTKRVWACPRAIDLLGGPGLNEVAGIAIVRGVKFKFKIDRYIDYEGCGTIVDIKSTRDASPWAFGRDAAKYSYPMSAAAYLNGLNELEKARRRFITIAVEKESPGVGFYEYSPTSLNAGEVEFDELLSMHLDAERNQAWPGYSDDIRTAMVPEWYDNKQEVQ